MKTSLLLELKLAFSLIFLVSNLQFARSQEFSFGRCPKFPTVKNFQPERYAGKWFEIGNYFAFFQLFGKCVTATYTVEPSTGYGNSGPTIVVFNEAVNQLTGAPIEAKGTAVLNDPNDPQTPGELVVNFDAQPSFTRASSTNYNIIDTDYDNFTIIYTCNDYGFIKSEILWILTRERFPDRYLIKSLLKKIRKLGLDTRRLKKTDQKNCPNNSYGPPSGK